MAAHTLDRAVRLSIPVGGGAALAVFGALYLRFPIAYYHLLTAWGVAPFRFPFLDAHAVLAAIECHGAGFDVYLYNPCDVLTRAHVYSPLFLEAAIFPVTIAWTNPVGIVLALGFFVALTSLPQPRGSREWVIFTLAMLSTMTAFAIERGNNDIGIFLIAALAGHLALRARAARMTAYFFVLFAACLKFYPVTLLLLTLRERPRPFLAINGMALCLLALFVAYYYDGLVKAFNLVPTGSYYTDLFGAVNLPFGIMALLAPLENSYRSAAFALQIFPWILFALLVLGCLRAAAATLGKIDLYKPLGEPEAIFLTIGGVLIVSCFFAGQNIGYRGIFFLFALPGLMAMGRPTGHAAAQFRTIAWLIVFLMWGECFRQALQHTKFDDPTAAFLLQTVKASFWLFRELIWWRVIGVLAGIVIGFAVKSETGRCVLSGLPLLRRAPP